MKAARLRSVESGQGRTESANAPGGRAHGEPVRLVPVVLPVTLAGLTTAALAAWAFAASRPSFAALGGAALLLAVATFAEAFPVPVDKVPADGVSLAAVFIVGTALVLGWEAAVLVAFLTQALLGLAERRPPVRVTYNAAVYAVAGGTAAGTAALIGARDGIAPLLATVAATSAAFYVVNVVLVALVVARWTGEPFAPLLVRSARRTAVVFAAMTSATLMLPVLWERSPLLLFALVGPLLAISLYQRSVHRALRAMKLALTDPLTGLGNHRHFHERLAEELERAGGGTCLTLCLVDLDDLKRINDRYGHPVGDDVLAELASKLRQGGDAFRLGGDEFALLLPGVDEHAGLLVGEAIVEKIAAAEVGPVLGLSVSAGVATFPRHAREAGDLVRLADAALYLAKEEGKGRVRLHPEAGVAPAALLPLAGESGQAAEFGPAAGPAEAVGAPDYATGSHSYRVGLLAAQVGARLGLDTSEVELLWIAGNLHDLGKVAIPEEILGKPGPLTESEYRLLAGHPEIGFRMLCRLGVEVVAEWVLHHHERWDGGGYPNGLLGEEIPLGARILFACDAYDAMTNDRAYRRRLSPRRALRELERCAGTQFDPTVVAALVACLWEGETEPSSYALRDIA